VNAEQSGPLLVVGLVGELEEECRYASGDDGDIETPAFLVVELGPLRDPLGAIPLGQDGRALAPAIVDGSHWFQLRLMGTEGLRDVGPGPDFDETRINTADQSRPNVLIS
jgi:hypothetical protein